MDAREFKQPRPVVFLATADDKDRPLHHLPAELRAVRQALGQAERAGLCELVERADLTPDDLRDVFLAPKYRHRVAIFHFAGHAGDYHLLLERASGEAAIADAGGLAEFLGQQRGLQLVFLNACSTQGQVEGLFGSVPIVIATSQAVRDDIARSFAEIFYQSLGAGAELRGAFEEAKAGVKLETSGDYRELFLSGHEETGQPWQLFVRPGAENAAEWNLPDAADNPLFGLPTLPPRDLPPKPFRHLNWFRQEDAELFFGRDYETRDLYRRVSAPSAPLTLLYGAAGVGKSSLLAAGLIPRLTAFEVRYVRRDADLGLSGTLAKALDGTVSEVDKVWHALERQLGMPLVLILDQFEESFTRPNPTLPDELTIFLDVLGTLFAEPRGRPRGQLILGFRKEWLAEVETRLRGVLLPYSKVFLKPLDRRGIIQAVTGPTRRERLRAHYGLRIAPTLPEVIADDLLEDTSSPIAPTLQVLLTKLWDAATAQNASQPAFTLELYQRLKREGILLADFLDQQLAALHAWRPEVVDSGLALDLLSLHTTPLGTAARSTLQELQALYAQRDDMTELVQKCQDLYLLTGPSGDSAEGTETTRLAHDTLAPLIRDRFATSVHPGQQARRILETRTATLHGEGEVAPLDAHDLATVEAGATGMRAWQPAERALITVSRKAAASHQAFWLVFGGALGAGVALGLLQALVVALSDFRLSWSSQLGIHGFFGTVLGAFICLGLVLPGLLRLRHQATESARALPTELLRRNLPSIISGSIGLALGSVLLGFMVRGDLRALLEQNPLLLPTSLLAGLGVSVALAGYPHRSSLYGLARLSFAALAFVLAQWLLVVTGSGGGVAQVVFPESYFQRNYEGVYAFFEARTATPGTVAPNDSAVRVVTPIPQPDEAATVPAWLPQTWYAQLTLLDAALVAAALTLGTAAGLRLASRQLGLKEGRA